MTTTEAGRRNTHSFRAWDATWEDLTKTGRAESFSPSTLLGDAADALAGYIRCARCGGTPVPVQFGNLAGRPLWEWITEAERAVRVQKCKEHRPVLVGAESTPASAVRQLREDIPGLVPASELAGPAAKFRSPDPADAAFTPPTVPVPAAADQSGKKGRSCKHPKVRGKGVCPDCHEWVGSKP